MGEEPKEGGPYTNSLVVEVNNGLQVLFVDARFPPLLKHLSSKSHSRE